MVCLNLPPDVRYDLKNIYVTAMIPGPKEPTLDNINNYMRPIAENLWEHYTPGVYISKTHKYPKGRKVRSAAPVTSMDIPASRAFGGLGGPAHTIFCSFCDSTLSGIDNFDPSTLNVRSIDDLRICVDRWQAARTSAERDAIWKDHAVRESEWLRFPWWNPFTSTTIAPLHWTKNILEKQIRENMGCSVTVHAGIPEPPPLSRRITTTELQWGYLAMLHCSASEFEKAKHPEPVLRYLCRERGIFEAGLSSKRLSEDLNSWRKNNFVIHADGSPMRVEQHEAVSVAKAEYYLSRTGKTLSLLDSHSTLSSLRRLCDRFSIPWAENNRKKELMERLVQHYKQYKIVYIPEPERSKREVSVLGLEIVAEVKADMRRTVIPSWLKNPPQNFATTDHGKLSAEEYKSLSLVSLPITLIRLWGNAAPQLRQRLDHFLHLSVAVRILAYQSLTSHDISFFEFHYQQYLNGLKSLYPFSSIVPVQHLGLHIPYFMRELGPSTRYSENTCEMFIGILEDICTNSRLGELEQTLHRELIMASNLKSLMEQQSWPELLSPYSDILSDFLQSRYPASERSTSTAWQTTPKTPPITLDQLTYRALSRWAKTNHIRPYTRNLFLCTKLYRGNIVYQPYTESSGNGFILFRPRGSVASQPGRIELILQEPSEAVALGLPRVILVVRSYQALSPEDEARDPYHNHPIVGGARFAFMRLFYDAVDAEVAYMIQPDDVICHIALTAFNDPERIMSAPCVVVLDLDLKHKFHS